LVVSFLVKGGVSPLVYNQFIAALVD